MHHQAVASRGRDSMRPDVARGAHVGIRIGSVFFGRDTHSCSADPRSRSWLSLARRSRAVARPPSTPMVAASINICASAKRSALMPPTQRLSTCRYLSAISVVRRKPSPVRLRRSAMRPSSSGSPPFGFGTIIWSIKACANAILCPAVACRQRAQAPMITLIPARLGSPPLPHAHNSVGRRLGSRYR